jgi:hypothetical protein
MRAHYSFFWTRYVSVGSVPGTPIAQRVGHQNPINVGQIDGFSLAKVEHEVGWQLACSLLE